MNESNKNYNEHINLYEIECICTSLDLNQFLYFYLSPLNRLTGYGLRVMGYLVCLVCLVV